MEPVVSVRVCDEYAGVDDDHTALSGFLRIVTHPRIFGDPTPRSVATEFVDRLVASPATQVTEPGERHLGFFLELCRDLELRGNAIPDAYLAALALEQGATFVTSDDGFHRFENLRVTRPDA